MKEREEEKERKVHRERERERGMERKRERERYCVCVCVCVCMRGKERERTTNFGCHTLHVLLMEECESHTLPLSLPLSTIKRVKMCLPIYLFKLNFL